MLISLAFGIYLRINGVKTSLLVYFENIRNIQIEKGTIIDSLSVIKGGKTSNYHVSIGTSTRIRRNCYISATKGIIDIGNDVLIAHNTWIAGRGKTIIGNNTLIGPNVVIISSNHDLSSDIYPLASVTEIPGKISIGSNCWIGANSTIVPDVSIGSNCIIAAGSVVTTDIPNYTLIAGNPAKPIRKIEQKSAHPYKEHNM